MQTYDFVIVGSGFAGIAAANILAGNGYKILLIERRSHIGGNSYDCYDENGILIHLYGPHIFHTKNKEVWDYLSQFTMWRFYEHKVLAHIDGKDAPLPFSLKTIEALFPPSLAKKLTDKLCSIYGYGQSIPVLQMMNHQDEDIKFLAGFIYRKVFLNYSVKQWGMKPEDIDPSVTARVPILVGVDDRYFRDPYQGIPINGFTSMFERMLDNKNISVLLSTDYKKVIQDVLYKKMIYTGPIDYFFDYKYGRLPYRSIDFDFSSLDIEQFQKVAVINYPNDHLFTRITEFKHLTGQQHPHTVIVKEYPKDCKNEDDVPSYPVYNKESLAIFDKYMNDIEKLDRTAFLGRLAEYKYYNMDEVVEKAMICCQKLI